MIELRDISVAFGERVLFRPASVTIGARDRIGLVGPNGSGKSTLLKILTGQNEPDTGQIIRAGWATTGYLRQEGLVMRGQSVIAEAETAFAEVRELQGKIDTLSKRIQEMDTSSEEYREGLEAIGALEHRLDDLDGHKARVHAERVLSGLGFRESDFGRDCGEFSGGWQMRIALAKLLLRQPSLLLLDEPTNHLDLPSLRWLERFLADYEGAVLLVSHDRAFLDNLTRRTWALDAGRLDDYAGNYSYYVRERAARKEAIERAARNQEKKIAQTERFIERFRYKNTKASQVQSRIKALEKVDRIEIDREESGIHFRFPEPPRSGQQVLEVNGIRKRYGDNLVLDGVNLRIERGDRLAIVGVNGAGKSTFARILAGVEAFEGERAPGPKTRLAFFAQDQADALDPTRSVLQTLEETPGANGSGTDMRTLLGAFLFRGDDVFKSVGVLSGGEKNRLALARMLLQQANLLIFDEPTNHLDMRSKDILREAIANYGGAVVIVSHDRDFLNPLVSKVLEVDRQIIRTYWGNVTDYVAAKEKEEASSAGVTISPNGGGSSVSTANASATSSRERRRLVAERNRQLAPLRRRAEELEADVTRMEDEIRTLEEKMADPAFFQRGEDTAEQVRAYESLKRKAARASDEWMEVTTQIEELASEE